MTFLKDLCDFRNEPGAETYRYALIACDSYTRALWAVPMVAKSKKDSMKAMRTLNKLLDSMRIPGINKPTSG